MEQCSEASAYKIQMPGNYAEESTQHSEHGESLKSRKYILPSETTISYIQQCIFVYNKLLSLMVCVC